MKSDLQLNFGYLFEQNLIDEIAEVGISKNFIADTTIIELGDFIKSMPLLISGAIKILREDENGDELVLYYLEKGDTCAMTLSCCMGQTKSKMDDDWERPKPISPWLYKITPKQTVTRHARSCQGWSKDKSS